MVELYKVKESDNQIEYKYLPENKISNGYGQVIVNKNNNRVDSYTLSKLEIDNDILIYRNHVYHAIKKFNMNGYFPEKYTVAWY
ncbi:hypothetical protein WL766_08610 [Staphylococcus pasteuri]|uniref:Phage protein n=3 Tax=Staphylococcus TaxID=1279 RepID=A0ABY1GZB3_9STAP|nr:MULTISPECIES: hypothetical protein [Staphylococcus]RQX28675.1 hypothetical protein DB792_02750 [Staphylococcus warneri]ATH62751.1 hypothetical protein BJG87_07100 [Staphylococcus pasteuri]KKI57254.1 hypothetical protein UF70_0897 [Staphylococcus pasteuri]MBL3397922.1 hypothetical protein [Staphylococcus pasteuri]MBM6507212.1 hypothetical protein [Staphylococcus pasteuri]